MTAVDANAIGGFGEDALRPDLHRQAIAALEASPLPALLDTVEAVQKAMLSANPQALQREVGWFGRLLGNDIAMQAEGAEARAQLGVHAIAAERQLEQVSAHRDRLSALRMQLLEAAAALLARAQELSPLPADAAKRRMQHLATLAGAYQVTASHLELSALGLDETIARVRALLPQARLLLDQQRILRHSTASTRSAP